MAPSGKADEQELPEKSCKLCSRATRSDIRCVVCNAAFHGSCVVRIAGTKVVGYNELHCSECARRHDEVVDEVEACDQKQCFERVMKTNETLNAVVLKLMADHDLLMNEMAEKNEILKENNKLLIQRIHYLEESEKKVNKSQPEKTIAQKIVSNRTQKQTKQTHREITQEEVILGQTQNILGQKDGISHLPEFPKAGKVPAELNFVGDRSANVSSASRVNVNHGQHVSQCNLDSNSGLEIQIQVWKWNGIEVRG